MQHLFILDSNASVSLQQQIKCKLIEAIINGYFPCGSKMPSTRKFAEQLNVARNTVVSAYEQLVDEGYLVSKERSGVFVSEEVSDLHIINQPNKKKSSELFDWSALLKTATIESHTPVYPENWQEYPYPFISDQFDPTLFPINHWRECSRLSLNLAEINSWARQKEGFDDAQLIEEIRSKVLPRRGIYVQPDEILITIGAQHALYLISQLLFFNRALLTTEEPGYYGVRQLAQNNHMPFHLTPVTEEGIDVEAIPSDTDYVYVTPSHQVPTAVTMSMANREKIIQRSIDDDFIIIEDDYESEANFINNPHPALKSFDESQRVIYLSSFSKVLTPGLRIGFMVGPKAFIDKAKELRRLQIHHVPANNQRTMRHFLSLGYYDSAMRKLNQALSDRWLELREALNHYLPTAIVTSHSQGGSSIWIKGPQNLNSQRMASEAAKRGILIEPVTRYYGAKIKPQYFFRLGVSSIPKENIREGVAQLAKLFNESDSLDQDVETIKGNKISGKDLLTFLSGVEFIGRTVFGEPYQISISADGTMRGWEGHNSEKYDEGKWWLEGDHWYRQWNHWSYGEVLGFEIFVDGNQINWVRDHKLVDSAFFRRANGSTGSK